MEPVYVLNRSYYDSPDKCVDEWFEAYAEIVDNHPELKTAAVNMGERILHARELFASLANLGSTPDDEAYALRVEQERKYYQEAEELDGDFPFGNEDEVFAARHVFSIREMAYIQLGLASEIDPGDLSEVPQGKIFTIGDPQEFSHEELVARRTAILDTYRHFIPKTT